MRTLVFVMCLLLSGSFGHAQEWENISDSLLETVPNYKDSWLWNRKVGTLRVDPEDGDLYVVLNNSYGVWHSEDRGDSWKMLTRETRGRTYGSYSVNLAPATGRMVVFMVGRRSAMSMDRGETWTPFGIPQIDDKHDGWTWGGVDWTAEQPQVILAKEHHKTRLWLSRDAGQTWKQLEYYTRRPGVLDEDVLVAGQDGGIHRSTDAGQSWQKVCETAPTGATPIRYGDKHYWVCATGLLVTDDAGATWKHTEGKLQDALWGPYFGADASEMMVVTKDGFHITRDGGTRWT